MSCKQDPFLFIESKKQEITEEELDKEVVPALLLFYDKKIRSLSSYVYGFDVTALAAFKVESIQTIKRAIHTFNEKNHWASSRELNSYILSSLNRLAQSLKNNIDAIKKVNVCICPACKELYGSVEILHNSKQIVCNGCTSKIEELSKKKRTSREEYALSLHKIFENHSKRGVKCPECNRFIPSSYLNNYNISCIYDDCLWFGTVNELESIKHPSIMCSPRLLSMSQDEISIFSKNAQIQFESDDIIDIKRRFEYEFNTVKEVIETQMRNVESNKIKKINMYQAYLNMLESDPDDMVGYLARLRSYTDIPLQGRIFQEYIRLLENSMPFIIKKFKHEYEIFTLLDPALEIFQGLSKFDAMVDNNLVIPNNTVERYINEYKDFGQCFIGYIDEIINLETNKSIKDKISFYSFTSIHMKDIPKKTPVKVIHLRLVPHYETGSLALLQRTRRKIVDSVYQRLNGKRRK